MPNDTPAPGFNRVLLKLSGEALLGEKSFGIDRDFTDYIAQEIRTGDLEFAATMICSLDTIVREFVPAPVYDTLVREAD